jgi:hypothetical protein
VTSGVFFDVPLKQSSMSRRSIFVCIFLEKIIVLELEKIIMQSAGEVGLRCGNLEKLGFPAREMGSRSNLRS